MNEINDKINQLDQNSRMLVYLIPFLIVGYFLHEAYTTHTNTKDSLLSQINKNKAANYNYKINQLKTKIRKKTQLMPSLNDQINRKKDEVYSARDRLQGGIKALLSPMAMAGIVQNILASGGTNMADGLQSALRLASSNNSERVKKILLLSDGQANQGISTPDGLSKFITQITQTGAVVSTIGMGLDFNESLLTTLADYGMGHYSYLENLSGLAQVLKKDLSDTRTIFANSSTLDIKLGKGVTVLDAGGYPLTKIDSTTLRITTGQILDNTDKHFVITFNIPVNNVGAVPLGKMQLIYQADNKMHQTPLMNESKLDLSVVEVSRSNEALKSVNKSIYRQTWTKNNLGQMKKVLSESVRDGDRDKAEKAIIKYKKAIKKAGIENNINLATPEVEEELKTMEDDVKEAFEGSASSQVTKQKRTSKSIQKDSISIRR